MVWTRIWGFLPDEPPSLSIFFSPAHDDGYGRGSHRERLRCQHWLCSELSPRWQLVIVLPFHRDHRTFGEEGTPGHLSMHSPSAISAFPRSRNEWPRWHLYRAGPMYRFTLSLAYSWVGTSIVGRTCLADSTTSIPWFAVSLDHWVGTGLRTLYVSNKHVEGWLALILKFCLFVCLW